MASAGANAERQDRARQTINAHMERISKSTGIAVPPPARADTPDGRQTMESDRIAAFLGLVADHVDPSNTGKAYAVGAGTAGNFVGEYNEQEEQAKAAKKGGKQATDEAGEGDDADTSPVSGDNVSEAVDQIARMRSKDKLQAIADNDDRVTVKDAAKARLQELQ
jgi:hypothetical protein